MVKLFTPAIDPGPTTGNNRSESKGLFGSFPIYTLVDSDRGSEFDKLISAFVACCSKVAPLMFWDFSRVFTEPGTEFSAQHAVDG